MAAGGKREVECSMVSEGNLTLQSYDTASLDLYFSGCIGLVVTADILIVLDSSKLHLHSRYDGKRLARPHQLEPNPVGMCLINNKKVAVLLNDSRIEIISYKSTKHMKLVKIIHVRTGFDRCYAVVNDESKNKLVVCGLKLNLWELCWCVVSITDGHVGTVHMICTWGLRAHLAIQNDTLYISCEADYDVSHNTGVYSYYIHEPKTIKFVYRHRDLKAPAGLTVDRRGYIFVCNRKNNIHQLTERGQLVTIHRLSFWPREIFYEDQDEVLYITQPKSNEITRYRLEYSDQRGIPIEILNMDERSIQLYEDALKDGKEAVYNIRVMVVGHMGVGKTTLIKRLLGEEVNISERHSTEGIDVYVNCCDVSLSTLQWTRQKKDLDQDYRIQRLARVLNKQQPTSNTVADKEQGVTLPDGETADFNACVTDEEHGIIPTQWETTDRNASVIDKEKDILPKEDETTDSDGSAKEKEQAITPLHVVVEDKDTELVYLHSSQKEFGHDHLSTADQQEELTLDPNTFVKSNKNTLAMLKLLQENVDKLKQDTIINVPLTIWDFAGQFAYYTTHQTFLTRRAIYLLVSDVSEQVTEIVADECYFDSKGITKCKVHELIEVWLNSIHSCASSPEATTPPVILVGTHVDKISQKRSPAKGKKSETETKTTEKEFTLTGISADAAPGTSEQCKDSNILGAVKKIFTPWKTRGMLEMTPDSNMSGAHVIPNEDQTKKDKKSRQWPWKKKIKEKHSHHHEICERYFREIRMCLKDKPTKFHLVDEDFAIDNTVLDKKLEDLKRKIVNIASQQSYWGEEIPARWIPLEQELMRLKVAGVKVIPLSLLKDLNQEGSVQIFIDELDLFLRYQHDIGTILYFSMDVLREKIVLDPQWLIDALKSLITADEMFILRNTAAVSEKWFEFKTKGKLSLELIDAIWTKEQNLDFHDNKEHLLNLMEQLNIIAKPRSYNEGGKEIKEEDYYLAPCMLRQATPETILCPEAVPDMELTSSLCFMFTGKFLPTPIFHRLVGACLTHWAIASQNSENLIYCGCCIFALDHFHRLTLYFRDYTIFARVTKMAATDISASSKICSEARTFIFDNLSKIIGNLGKSLEFEQYIQCPISNAGSLEGLIPLPLIQSNERVVCHSHDKSHTLVSRQLCKFWFEEEKPSDDASFAVPMASQPVGDTDRFMRVTYLLVDVGSRVLRQLLCHHTVHPACTLDQYLVKNRKKLDSLLKRKVLHQSQMDIMFPPSGGNTNIDDYDITLLSALINNIVPSLNQQEKNMIKSLRDDRNRLYGHAKSCKLNTTDYHTSWQSVSSTLLTLSQQCADQNFQNEILHEIQRTESAAVPTGSYLDILQTWFSRVELVEGLFETAEGAIQALTGRVEALELKKITEENEA